MLLSSKLTTRNTLCRSSLRALRCFSSEDRVETKIDEHGICRVTLNRADKLNAVDLAMFEAVAETASNLRSDRNIRVVILNGSGRAFCSGLDVVRSSQKMIYSEDDIGTSFRFPCSQNLSIEISHKEPRQNYQAITGKTLRVWGSRQ